MAAVAIGQSQPAPTGVARADVLIDTQQSELAAEAPVGAETLWWRASLLGMLLGTQQERSQIARTLGVPVDEVGASDVQLGNPIVPAALPVAASQAASTLSMPYVLKVNTDNVLPVISLEADAPNRTQAARLAQAAVQELRAGTPEHDTRQLQGLNVTEINPVKTRDLTAKSSRSQTLVVAVIVFGLWWTGVILVRRVRTRGGRRASASAATA
jgi:hypothetical protein